MGTLQDLKDNLPQIASEAIKTQILEKIPSDLKQKMYDSGGDIEVDLQAGTWDIIGHLSDDLKSEIIQLLKK